MEETLDLKHKLMLWIKQLNEENEHRTIYITIA